MVPAGRRRAGKGRDGITYRRQRIERRPMRTGSPVKTRLIVIVWRASMRRARRKAA